MDKGDVVGFNDICCFHNKWEIDMDSTDILALRLYNQLLGGSGFTRPVEVVSWLGAMQAQNYEMAKWGIGVRLPGVTNKEVEDAVNAGEIIRTHVLRPTWHFITAEDAHWMIALSGPRLKPTFSSYFRTRGLEDAFIGKALDMLCDILEEHGHLTRLEIYEHFAARGFALPDNQDAGFIISYAELDGAICNGIVRGSKQTYALMHERVPKKVLLSREESIERLTRRYFASHGPATIDDFIWWSGMTRKEAKVGIELIRHDFICEKINSKLYWMPTNMQTPPEGIHMRHLLPAFDEFVVSYKDREEIIDERYYRKVLTMNGLFSPTIHHNGRAVGSWKRVNKKSGVVAELAFFPTTPKKVQGMFKQAEKEYLRFNM